MSGRIQSFSSSIRTLLLLLILFACTTLILVFVQEKAQAKDFCVNRDGCTEANTFNGDPTVEFKAALAKTKDVLADQDRVLLGPGTYIGNFSTTSSDKGPVLIEGSGKEGDQKTVIQAELANSPALTLSTLEASDAPDHSGVSNLAIELSDEGQTGLQLENHATAQDIYVNSSIFKLCLSGVQPTTGVVIDDGSVAEKIKVQAYDCNQNDNIGVRLFHGKLTDSVINGGKYSVMETPRGVIPDDGRTTVERVEINPSNATSAGVYVTDPSPSGSYNGIADIYDTLIRPPASPSPARYGIKVLSRESLTANIARVTIASSQTQPLTSFALGVDATDNAIDTPTAKLTDSVIYNFAKNLECKKSNTKIQTTRSYYPGSPSCPSAGTLQETTPVTVQSPGFFDPAQGDFHLVWGSELIDKGTPKPSGFVIPANDIEGTVRFKDGDSDGQGAYDLGAYEYAKRKPKDLFPSVEKSPIAINEPVKFTASATDPDPGDTIEFIWNFDDGTNIKGAEVTKAFQQAGIHTATVIAKDQSGETEDETVQVTVLAPGGDKKPDTNTNGSDNPPNNVPTVPVTPSSSNPPSSRIQVKSPVRSSKFKQLNGTASSDQGVKTVLLSITKRSKKDCLALQSNGRFKRYKKGSSNCKAKFLITAKGTVSWFYKFKKALPKGTYTIQSQAIDMSQKKERNFVVNRSEVTVRVR